MQKETENVQLLDVIEALLKAQLKAIKDIQRNGVSVIQTSTEEVTSAPRYKRNSHTTMAYEVLLRVGKPLHILEIVRQIQDTFGVSISRDTLVSAMIKKAIQGKQFVKTGKNTFGILGRDES